MSPADQFEILAFVITLGILVGIFAYLSWRGHV